MTKMIIIPSKQEDINYLLDTSIDGFIFGVNNFSVETNFTLNLTDISKYQHNLKHANKKTFISLNKNIYEGELLSLKKLLLEISLLDIDGLFFYDLAILNIVNELKLKIKLIWAQTYLTTNYHTINYYYNQGVIGTLLAAEITLKEILDIKNNTSSLLFGPMFGYFPISASRRYLVSNYLEFTNNDKNSSSHYLKYGDDEYPIIEDKEGTHVYNSTILNGFSIPELLNLDYGIINGFNISFEKILKVIDCIKNNKLEEISNMFDKLDTGFFFKNTYYKVKKND